MSENIKIFIAVDDPKYGKREEDFKVNGKNYYWCKKYDKYGNDHNTSSHKPKNSVKPRTLITTVNTDPLPSI